MKKIMFRAWDIYENIMIYNVQNAYDTCFAIGLDKRNKDIFVGMNSFGEVLGDDQRFILMQCTGIKDKKGKGIYEGDIVKVFDCPINKWIDNKKQNYLKKEGIAVIEYSMCSYVLNYINLNKDEYCSEIDATLMRIMYAARIFEVIGNIYENPELLEQPK